MKIHYNEEFNCFETTECHKTDNIELDGVRLIPISELEKIKAEVIELSYNCEIATVDRYRVEKLIDNHIFELKGE